MKLKQTQRARSAINFSSRAIFDTKLLFAKETFHSIMYNINNVYLMSQRNVFFLSFIVYSERIRVFRIN